MIEIMIGDVIFVVEAEEFMRVQEELDAVELVEWVMENKINATLVVLETLQ